MTSIPVPTIDYLPQGPRTPERHKIGLIGCGNISSHHLEAARSFGVEVVALADINPEAAEKRRLEFFPDATVYTDHRELLARPDITVADIATHTAVRSQQIEEALLAGKHVLSQKPFTFDLEEGLRLADLADAQGLRLGINQNGRWAPQFGALITAVRSGLLGDIHTLDMVMAWDHTFTRGTFSENLHHLILSDFAIHYFDTLACVFEGRSARSVFANAVKAPHQDMAPPMLAHAIFNFGEGLATLGFSAYETASEKEFLCCVGSRGTLRGLGPINRLSELEYANREGTVQITLKGNWFPDGFRGTLGEFLRSLEEDREPTIGARNNLRSLELCFAALASADSGEVVVPGSVRKGRL